MVIKKRKRELISVSDRDYFKDLLRDEEKNAAEILSFQAQYGRSLINTKRVLRLEVRLEAAGRGLNPDHYWSEEEVALLKPLMQLNLKKRKYLHLSNDLAFKLGRTYRAIQHKIRRIKEGSPDTCQERVPYTEEDFQRMSAFRRYGKTVQWISEKYGITKAKCYYYIKIYDSKHDVPDGLHLSAKHRVQECPFSRQELWQFYKDPKYKCVEDLDEVRGDFSLRELRMQFRRALDLPFNSPFLVIKKANCHWDQDEENELRLYYQDFIDNKVSAKFLASFFGRSPFSIRAKLRTMQIKHQVPKA